MIWKVASGGGGDGRKKEGCIGSVIGVGTSITGNIVFSGGLRVDGEVRGNISGAAGGEGARLVIGERGRVEGECVVSRVTISGTVIGETFAGERVELLRQAQVTGDINYGAIEMHPGAVVHGRLAPGGEAGQAGVPAPANAAAG